jgi:hypothetical protein
MKLLFIQILLIVSCTVYSQTPRGRAQIKDETLVTDRGTLLRGAFVSTDIVETLPLKTDVSNIKNLGLNCIHLYAECPEFQNHGGERATLVDSIVKWTREDSLYLILTIGGCNKNGQFNLTFVKEFWNFYAPRYKDETHVIFEIVNEPFSWSAPYDSVTLDMERTAYTIIRSHAPLTHVLFMSYGSPKNVASVISDNKKLGADINWSNASIATHGYGIASTEVISFIKTVKDAGYAITFTEPASIQDKYVNLATTRVFEKEFVSYTHFISVQSINADPSVFKSKIDSSELRWTPDFGSWPGNISKIIYKDPYRSYDPGFYDEGYGFNIYGKALGSISNNDYVAFFNFDFKEGPDTFKAICSSAGTGGFIELHIDSMNGLFVGSCLVSPTGSWDLAKTFSCKTDHFDGIHNLYLLFKGGIWDLFNLNSFVFKKSDGVFINPLISGNQKMQIYPNPAKDIIHVSCEESSIVEICNVQGNISIRKQLTTLNNSILIGHLSAGCYVVKIFSNAKAVSRILIIE